MGSLRTRITILIAWLLMGAAVFGSLEKGWITLALILVVAFIGVGMGMGVILFGDPLPPRKGDICQQCKFRFATVTKDYWAYGSTVPSGGVKLCDECADHYDPNYDWGRKR